MQLSEAKAQMESRISRIGVELHRPDPGLLWEVFRDFAHISFTSPFSALLFMAGVSSSAHEDIYHVEMGRQFSNQAFVTPIWNRRKPDRFYMLGIRLAYEPDDELIGLIEQRFSSASENEREFLTRIEVLPIFQAAFYNGRPIGYELVMCGKPFEVK